MRHRRKKRQEGHHQRALDQEDVQEVPEEAPLRPVGIDPRIRLFAALSDGRRLDRQELNKGWKTLPARQSRSAEA